MADLKNGMKKFIADIAQDAHKDLSFMYQRHLYASLKDQAQLLACRSPEEINRYISTRALQLRESSGANHVINPGELYVVSRIKENSIECAYMRGAAYHAPPVVFPTASQMKEMWKYLFTLSGNDQWFSFQDFFEKKIIEAMCELQRYEDMLEQEITPLMCVLRSQEGVLVHNLLYDLAQKTVCALREQVQPFKKGKAPVFMQVDLAKKLQVAKEILFVLRRSEPRNA